MFEHRGRETLKKTIFNIIIFTCSPSTLNKTVNLAASVNLYFDLFELVVLMIFVFSVSMLTDWRHNLNYSTLHSLARPHTLYLLQHNLLFTSVNGIKLCCLCDLANLCRICFVCWSMFSHM